MRGFFILLLLTNMAYFAWQFVAESGQELHEMEPVVREGTRLTMLTELDETRHPALRESVAPPPAEVAVPVIATAPSSPEPVQEVVAAPPPTRLCIMVQAIQDKSEADALIALLKEQGAGRIEQGEEAGTRINYWVKLPRFADRAAAEVVAGVLREQKVQDFFIIRSGEHENAISLGVFSSMERAERRAAQLRRLANLNATSQIELMELPTRYHWVGYRIEADSQQVLQPRIESFGQIKQVVCD